MGTKEPVKTQRIETQESYKIKLLLFLYLYFSPAMVYSLHVISDSIHLCFLHSWLVQIVGERCEQEHCRTAGQPRGFTCKIK